MSDANVVKLSTLSILNLELLTNDVILHFNDANLSRTMHNNSFDGTFYEWELTGECISKLNQQ